MMPAPHDLGPPPPLQQKNSWDVDGLDPAALEEQRKIMEQIERSKNVDLCSFCNMPIDMNDEVVLLQTTDCFHSVHMNCFKKAAILALTKNSLMACPKPDCGKVIAVSEQKNYLSAEEL